MSDCRPECSADTVIACYGTDVFNAAAMRKYLSPQVCEAVDNTITKGAAITKGIADEVANGMKAWAIDKGATHFTHWFQPLTGATAEKHDSFIVPDAKGGAMAAFSGKELIQGEPDASSFPSGGLRATFEARGYTAWDPTSPAFVLNAQSDRAVLCVPCVFCGYHGETLDEKTPLLRSQAVLAKQLWRVARIFEVEGTARPYVTLGPEQEYFLIDSGSFHKRPDLVMCGRTLLGNRPARHQQMEDHYFGRIEPRILAFMASVDRKLWRLGVPARTRHNEVSPCQFELAPVFEEQNLSVDHNMIVMHTLRDTAAEHGFACLLHEKPFAGVNGSGKHNNWSIVGNDGKNWFNPGRTPHDNLKFLFMLTAFIKAVDTHAPLIRSFVATAGNDHRLGANEAPPAIISLYLGERLEEIIDAIDSGESFRGRADRRNTILIEIGVDALPKIPRDVSDRNRTSPMAFTGNKFEFRAVGSSQSCAGPNTVLNLVMAAALDEMCAEAEALLPAASGGKDETGHNTVFHRAVKNILCKEIKAHRRVLFGGDGYSGEWQAEAARRGLPNLRSTPEALPAMTSPESIALFGKYGVLSEREVESRYEVYRHAWEQTVMMEGGCLLDIARTFIVPVALDFEEKLAGSVETARRFGRDPAIRLDVYRETADLVDRLHLAIAGLEKALRDGAPKVIEAMAALRAAVDGLEALCPDMEWPVPCYGALFFGSTRGE